MSPRGLSRVLIAGGGIAGLEALLALHDLAVGRVRMTLLSCTDEFVCRPTALAESFGRGRAIRRPLTEIAARAGAELVRGRLAAVDSSSRTAITTAGGELAYDALLVAVGAPSEPAVPGALTWTPEADAELLGGLLRDLEEGYTKRVAFVVPPGVAWTLPVYELALIAAWQAWDMGQDDITATIYTPRTRRSDCSDRARSRRCREILPTRASGCRPAYASSRTRWRPAGSSSTLESVPWTPSVWSRWRRRSDPGWRACPATMTASCRPIGTVESPGSTASGRRAT
jgi:hypothetical protein